MLRAPDSMKVDGWRVDTPPALFAMGWDFTAPKQFMIEHGIYTPEEIDQVELEYRRYIMLCMYYPEKQFTMSKKVDDFWHVHILFTEDYSSFCQVVFGRYLHHRPAILDGDEKIKRLFEENTLPLYELHFGKPDRTFWDYQVCICANNTVVPVRNSRVVHAQ